MPMSRLFSIAFITAMLAACGQKGPLVLPDDGKPVKGASNKPVSTTPVDNKQVSTKPVANKQLSGKAIAGKPLAGKALSTKPMATEPYTIE